MGNAPAFDNSDPEVRHWFDLSVCWTGLVPYQEIDAAPQECVWTLHDSPALLESEYKMREAPFHNEMIQWIADFANAKSSPPTAGAAFFLGQRWSVVEQFLNQLSASRNGGEVSIIPPPLLDEGSIFKWLMTTWWDSHGVRNLVDMYLVNLKREPEYE